MSGLVRARGLKLYSFGICRIVEGSGLVRARGLKRSDPCPVKVCIVRARKSPWIETEELDQFAGPEEVRARKSPWIETSIRGTQTTRFPVRARKSPWIETGECRSESE